MAKKKSGAQREAWKRRNDNPASAFHGILRSGKRGRPKGETERHQELQNQIHKDLAQLGLPYKPDLYSYLAKNLLDPRWRIEYQLTPPHPEAYTMIGRRHFRREIELVHRRVWGGPKSRSLWQHWRHQKYRATKITPP